MSNVETDPDEIVVGASGRSDVTVQVLTPRAVPLGGPRAMTVRRTLPRRERSLVGAWCFVDHYGPDEVAATGGMDVPPHPHTGLATVSWLFTGEIEHRDSSGVHAIVRPGALDLMTGGHGVAHSEVSTPATTTLHGAQLWFALPDTDRDAPRSFAHHVPTPIAVDGAVVRVFLGALAGDVSPVPAPLGLLGAEIVLDPGATTTLAVDPAHEHAVLVDHGTVTLAGTALAPAELGVLDAGPAALDLAAGGTGARVLLLGGAPLGEEIVMWWNFVARTHDEIVAFRTAWEDAPEERFGRVEGYVGRDGASGWAARLPAPALPHARIRPRGNPGRLTVRRRRAGPAARG